MPDGKHLVATRMSGTGKAVRRSIVIVEPRGEIVRTVLRLGPPRKPPGRDRLISGNVPVELAASPDGSQILATFRGWRKRGDGKLVAVSVETGERRLIAERGRQGSWSPDGSRIVFVSDRDRNGNACWEERDCRIAGEVYTAGSDGSDPVRITRTKADEASPSWSPDGKRVVFASNRPRPRLEVSFEIYSATPEGGCLTWLTNGSPASEWPSWTGPSSASSDPGGCGPVERKPLVEGAPAYLWQAMAEPRLWLGPTFENSLYSGSFDLVFMSFTGYTDCGGFRPSDCPAPFTMVNFPTCFVEGDFGEYLGGLRRFRVARKRGAALITTRTKGRRAGILMTGGVMVSFYPGDDAGWATVPAALESRIIRALRPAGARKAVKRLPGVRIPAPSLRKMLRVRRAVARTGSLRRAAARLRMKPRQVQQNLRGLKVARRMGPLKAQRCNSRLVDDPWGISNAEASGSGAGGLSGDTGAAGFSSEAEAGGFSAAGWLEGRSR